MIHCNTSSGQVASISDEYFFITDRHLTKEHIAYIPAWYMNMIDTSAGLHFCCVITVE